MAKKFQNKYRSESFRLKNWDYSSNGLYFITICSAKFKHIFGKIEGENMILSEIGIIADEEWDKSFEIRTELSCHAFIIMPNHLHALLEINSVKAHGCAPPAHKMGIAYRPPKSISSFVAGFKSAATTRINQLRKTPNMPVWHPKFHDHIIRNDLEYLRIKNYIENNPKKWNDDKFNGDNL